MYHVPAYGLYSSFWGEDRCVGLAELGKKKEKKKKQYNSWRDKTALGGALCCKAMETEETPLVKEQVRAYCSQNYNLRHLHDC